MPSHVVLPFRSLGRIDFLESLQGADDSHSAEGLTCNLPLSALRIVPSQHALEWETVICIPTSMRKGDLSVDLRRTTGPSMVHALIEKT